MAKYRVELTGEEREELLARVNRGRGSAAEIKRANILLAVDRGELAELRMTDEEAAQESSRCLRCDQFGYGNFKGGRVEKW